MELVMLNLTIWLPSSSLGCKAVFLLGGKSREDQPIAMFLRSGDIVLMAGEARECFHGQYRYMFPPFVSFHHFLKFKC